MQKRRPWRMFAPLAVVLVIAVAWIGYWMIASATIKDAYRDAESHLAADGLSLACTNPEWGGFPFRIERICPKPVLSIDRAGQQIAVSASYLLLAVEAYNPRHATALLDGTTLIRGSPAVDIRHDRALASLVYSGEDSWQASLEVPKLAVENIGQAGRFLAHARAAQSGNVDAALSVEKLDLAFPDTPALSIDALDVAATIAREALTPDIARYLATTGKEVAVTNITARQGELTITGSGTVSVDGEGYPVGRIRTRVNRPDLVLENVIRFADLSDDEIAAARTFVGLLQKDKVGDPQIDLIAKNRTLYWGPFKLADLQPLF